MNIANFDYVLPKGSIAQSPLDERDASKLLVGGDPVAHMLTKDLPKLLRTGDVLVLNETRVMPSRLLLKRVTGASIEVLALEEVDDGRWEALVRPSRKVSNGEVLVDHNGKQIVQIGESTGKGTRIISSISGEMKKIFKDSGEIPLPPYIDNKELDTNRYQTIYAMNENSVAAPTAGLHLTERVIDQCAKNGVSIATLELSVGIGTFRPISTDSIHEHIMHAEGYRIGADTWEKVQNAKRVVAVGTTVVRALESVAHTGELEGKTELYIKPGFNFKVVNALMTNFHLPKSSLLVMIEAFIGERWKDLYQIALQEGYRFLSFGDAMFIERSD